MIRRILPILAFAFTWAMTVPSWAVIVYLKDSDQPVQGFLVRQNSILVVVDELLPSGERRQREIPMAQVELVKPAFDAERMATLSPDKPQDYRTYAEELAAVRDDPESREAALRLYQIAAYHDPQNLGRSCLLGMAGLARTPAEERAFHAMAFVLDGGRDASLLKPTKLVAANFVTLKATQRASLRLVVQKLRMGQIEDARRRLRAAEVKEAKDFYAHLLSDDEYEGAIRARGELSDRLLRKLLVLEITLAAQPVSEEADDKSNFVSWSDILASENTAPIPSLSLETLTEFDPRKAIYRDGKWVAE